MKKSKLRKLIQEAVRNKTTNKLQLQEVEYSDIFSPDTLQILNKKSRQELLQLGKSLPQLLSTIRELMPKIQKVEEPYRDLLEEIAKEMVTEAYPVIKNHNIKIIATLGQGTLPTEAKQKPQEPKQKPQKPKQKPQEPQEEPQEPQEEPKQPQGFKSAEMKRRIINGITHGAAIRGTFGLLLFREYIDELNPELVDEYTDLMKSTFGTYDDEEGLAYLMNIAAQMNPDAMKTGESEADIESTVSPDGEIEQRLVIRAAGTIFPVLVHEIVKGLYEILSLSGFSGEEEADEETVSKVDILRNEPLDLRYGKFIYDSVSDLYAKSGIRDTRVREYFFKALYEMEDDLDFLDFIENAVTGELTASQKKWAIRTMKEIESDLEEGNTELEDM